MRTSTMRTGTLALVLACACSPSLMAQGEPEVDLAELLRQIRRNMIEVEKDLDRAQAEAAKASAAEAKEKLDKLAFDMNSRGNQITKDIDELIENMPQCSGGGSSGGSGKSQKPSGKKDSSQSKSRDRNNPENQGKEPQGSKPGKPQNGEKEDNSAKDDAGGKNRNAPPRQDPKAKARHVDVEGRWGNLPPELRQRLVESNLFEFTPDYQEEIKAYFKRVFNP